MAPLLVNSSRVALHSSPRRGIDAPSRMISRLPYVSQYSRETFVLRIPVDLNATQAAIRAGYSARSAGALAVARYKMVKSGGDQRSEGATCGPLRLQRTTSCANCSKSRGRPAVLYDDNGNLKDIHSIPEDARKAIAGIEVDEIWEGRGEEREQTGVTRKVKLWDNARSSSGKHLEALPENEHHGARQTGRRVSRRRGPRCRSQMRSRFGRYHPTHGRVSSRSLWLCVLCVSVSAWPERRWRSTMGRGMAAGSPPAHRRRP